MTPQEEDIEREMRPSGMTEREEIELSRFEEQEAELEEEFGEWWTSLSSGERAEFLIDLSCGTETVSMESTTRSRVHLPDVMIPF